MIKPSEIRIGGYVHYNNQVLQIESYCNGKVNVYAGYYGDTPHVHGINCGDIDPIPITPEWLERCGFTTDGRGDDNHSEPLWDHQKTRYQFSDGSFVHNGQAYDDWLDIGDVKYVHQLQNLYFALTGEEIEFKLP